MEQAWIEMHIIFHYEYCDHCEFFFYQMRDTNNFVLLCTYCLYHCGYLIRTVVERIA